MRFVAGAWCILLLGCACQFKTSVCLILSDQNIAIYDTYVQQYLEQCMAYIQDIYIWLYIYIYAWGPRFPDSRSMLGSLWRNVNFLRYRFVEEMTWRRMKFDFVRHNFINTCRIMFITTTQNCVSCGFRACFICVCCVSA